MTTRALGPTAGLDWIRRAINLGAGNPRAVFGGAALFFVAIMGAAIVMSLVLGLFAATLQPGGTASLALSLAITLPLLLLAACLMVGYLRIIDAVEGGRPASAGDTFAGFADMQTSLRAFGLLLALVVVQNALLAGIVAVFSPGLAEWYVELMQAQSSGEPPTSLAMTPPEGSGLAIFLVMVLMLLVYAVQSIGLGQVALAGRSVGGALADGFSGAIRNLLPLLVLVLLAVVAAIVAGIVLLLVAMVIGLLASLLGNWIAFVLGVPLYVAIVLAMVVVSFGVMYHMWRDITGGGTAPPPLPADSVEL
jgi:hypothetical protein